MANVVSYRRVSTETQVTDGEGLEIQLERINEFCIRNNFNCIEHFVDEGVSGAKEAIDRDGIMELLTYCKAHSNEIDFVVVDKTDRLSRELLQQLFIEKQLLVDNISILYSDQEVLNGTDATTELMRQIVGAFAEFERKMINQRLSDGKRKKANNGDKPTGRQPFGYAYADNRKSTVINEAEAKIVRSIFDYRIRGLSLEQIATYLNTVITDEQRQQFSSVNRKRKWTHRSVSVILSNDYYTGNVTHDGKKIKGNHEPIIDIGVWNKANIKKIRRKTA